MRRKPASSTIRRVADAVWEENRWNNFISLNSWFPCSAQGVIPIVVEKYIGREGGAVEFV
jgi:hypothetical protein